MMKLAGIPVSDLTELSETQKNSTEFQEAIAAFNNTKQNDNSSQVKDSDSDISEQEFTLVRNILILMCTTERKDLPIITEKDRRIYIKLLLDNVLMLVDNFEKLSSDSLNTLTDNATKTINFNDIYKDKYKIFIKPEPSWLKNINITYPEIVITNRELESTSDIFYNFINNFSSEESYPKFGINIKDEVDAYRSFNDTLFNIPFNQMEGITYTIYDREEDTIRHPYNFNIVDIDRLNRKLTSKFKYPDDEFYNIMPENSTYQNYVVEIFADFTDDYSNIDKKEESSFTVSTDNIEYIIDTIDIMKDWRYE